MIFSLLASVALLGGCFLEGDDGSTGPAGPAGADGQDVDPATVDNLQGQIDDLNAALEAASQVEPESCSACHGDVGEEEHQSIYDDYIDASNLSLTITDVASVDDGAGGYNVTMTISIEQNGLPYVDADGLPGLDQKRFYVQGYDPACTGGICYPQALNSGLNDAITAVGNGVYEVTEAGVSFAIETMDGQAYGYIAQDKLDTEPAGHVTLYANVSNAALAFGAGADYVSPANVEGCTKCHGSPYMKHGYRAAAVDGIGDFSACKVCHLDDRDGSHEDWQYMVDDPYGWATGATPTADYSYKRKIMNDVHMAHAMEFPYPMSMANCATCHEGKMDMVNSDDLFVAATCKSCHPVQSTPEEYVQPHRAPALEDIWAAEGVGFHDIDDDCQICHTAASGYTGDAFSEIHTGYDPTIYTATGERYADEVVVTIDDDFTYDAAAKTITFNFSATSGIAGVDPANIDAQIYIAGYGYDTKNALVPAYPGAGYYNPDYDTPENPNLYYEVTQDGATWTATYDLTGLETGALYVEGAVRRIEIGVAAKLLVGDVYVATKSATRTFSLEDGAYVDYYSDVVNFDEKCSNCHDQLMPHGSHNIYASSNVRLCRECHAPYSGASHYEMQSRSFDSYIHAIHSFQAADTGTGRTDFTDPVEAARYELHIEHTFPNFTIKNCEGCHVEGVYNVPDQSKSLPGIISSSATWNVDRNIGDVPSYVVGPASRACGGCHRAEFINEDEAGELAAWNQHTKTFGYLVEDGDGVLGTVIEKIMGMF